MLRMFKYAGCGTILGIWCGVFCFMCLVLPLCGFGEKSRSVDRGMCGFLTWVAVLLPSAGGLVLGLVSFREVRRQEEQEQIEAVEQSRAESAG